MGLRPATEHKKLGDQGNNLAFDLQENIFEVMRVGIEIREALRMEYVWTHEQNNE